jgi:hypothetical protein
MAAFERARIAVRSGAPEDGVIDWDRNPDAVFAALGDGTALPPPEPGIVYRLYMSPDGSVRCELIEDAPA